MTLGFNHWLKLAFALKPANQTVIHRTAKEWQKWARAYASVDTGFMQENVYVSDMQGSDYGTGGIAPPDDDSYLLPEEIPPDNMSAIVGAAANYSIYQEMGTRFMPAQPFFYPAAEEASAFFDSEMGKVESRLAAALI